MLGIYIPLWLDLLPKKKRQKLPILQIYIPLWLDLLCFPFRFHFHSVSDLHSTMVRFIITLIMLSASLCKSFTFHYGQIYYDNSYNLTICVFDIYIPLWLDLLFGSVYIILAFAVIYIPLWLDLLSSWRYSYTF